MSQNQNERRRKNTIHEQFVRQLQTVREDEAIRRQAIRERLRGKQKKKFQKKLIRILIFSGIAVFLVFFLVELILPGSFLKKRRILSDTPLDEVLEAALDGGDDEEEGEEENELSFGKEYARLDGITEEQLLWNLLMDYFDGSKPAVLGIMCNLHAESAFSASNLEDYNNRLWDITDDIYTEEVNRKTIDKQDFLESRTVDSTNGYYNENDQWVNRDGGYGFAQFTAYDKKEALYQFAEQWFGPGGPGAGYKFNIGDPEMQAHFVIHLLNSEEYHEMEDLIRHAAVPVDACYYWLKMYEEPYDPYCDDYYTLAFERAAVADQIEERCQNVSH